MRMPCTRSPSARSGTSSSSVRSIAGTSTRSLVIDRERLLAKLDELDGYVAELRSIAPPSLEEYKAVEKRRACERLLQLMVQAAIDACGLVVTGLRLGLPGQEDDLFEKLAQRGVISPGTAALLRQMRGLRKLLGHEYGRINDEVLFDAVHRRLRDFQALQEQRVAT